MVTGIAAASPAVCTYVLLAGLPGTGKSTLARALAARLDALGSPSVVLNKDDVRAALFPGSATDYSEPQNALTIDCMLAAADYLRRKPSPPRYIFFDGRTFSRAAQVEHVLAAADPSHASDLATRATFDWSILHLVCTDEAAEARLSHAENHPAADRSFQLYLALKQTFEPIARTHVVIDSTLPLESMLQAALDALHVHEPRDP